MAIGYACNVQIHTAAIEIRNKSGTKKITQWQGLKMANLQFAGRS